MAGYVPTPQMWGTDEELTATIPLMESLQEPMKPKPMFSGPGDMAQRRLAVLEQTDPAAAMALRQQLAQVQGEHQLEMKNNDLHDQARMTSHYGRDVETQPGPLPQSEVAGMVNRQKQEDFLRLNPGMSRFLGGQPQRDAPNKFPLMDSLVENTRNDNGTQYGAFAGRQMSRQPGGSWSVAPKHSSEMTQQEAGDLARYNSPKHKAQLAQNAIAYKEKMQGKSDARVAAKTQEKDRQYQLQMEQAKNGGITPQMIDSALQTYGPQVMPLIQSLVQGQSEMGAARMRSQSSLEASKNQTNAAVENQKQADQREYLKQELAQTTDPVKQLALKNAIRRTLGLDHEAPPTAERVAGTPSAIEAPFTGVGSAFNGSAFLLPDQARTPDGELDYQKWKNKFKDTPGSMFNPFAYAGPSTY